MLLSTWNWKDLKEVIFFFFTTGIRSKTQRCKNQCKAWFLVPITILKYECWVSACAFPLLCQQEQFIGNCEHSEADHMSLAHKPHSKAPSPLWRLRRNTGEIHCGHWPGDREVPLLDGVGSCRMDSSSDDPGSWLCRWFLQPTDLTRARGPAVKMGKVTVSVDNKQYRREMRTCWRTQV